MLKVTAGITAVVMALAATSLACAVPLVVAGRPRATIVLAEKPTASAQLAAFELRHYIRKMSGVVLPIVRETQAVAGTRILVGESAATRALGYANDGLQEQEYVIKTFPNALLLMGRDRQYFEEVRYDDLQDFNSLYYAVLGDGLIGTCYAVHDFLENTLGVRWYYPNEEIGEVVPALGTIEARNLKVRRQPDAPVRVVYPLYANTERLYFTEWDHPERFETSWVDPRASLLYWIRNRFWGGTGYCANHSFDAYGRAFGETHPEWFSTKSAERMKQLDYQMEVQPCLSAPGLLEHVVQTARDYFDGKPEPFPGAYRAAVGGFFSVMPNDNTSMCGCPDCRAQYRSDFGPTGNASHYVWGFVNQVANEVRKTHPQAMISCCAYFNYTVPPEGLVFEPNVAVQFCKFYTGYADPTYQERDYQRIGGFVRDNQAALYTTWEYLLKPHITEWAFPCLVPHVHADDVKHLCDIGGFRGGYAQFLYMSPSPGGGVAQVSPVLDFMNLYWRMKLYDNFQFDFEAGLEEYYRGFFGPGAEGMSEFYTAMEKRWMEQGGGAESRSWWGKMGTPEFLAQVSGHVQQARDATAEGSLYRRRVELIEAGILQHMREGRARYEGSAMSEFAPIATAGVAWAEIPAGADWADDATWANALDNEIEKTIENEPAPQKTVFRLAHDGRKLYLRARCLEPQTARIKAATRDKDIGAFSDDSLELFLDPQGQGNGFYQFCINSLGAVYDALVDPKAIGAGATVTWDSGIEVKTTVGADHWELRAALPFAAMAPKPPSPGATWRLNLCRNRFVEPEGPPFSAWSPTLGAFGTPDRFGVITFNAPEDAGRLLWNCDFSSSAFATETGESPLIGLDGWYENPEYANRGWDKSWKVVQREGNGVAVCDVSVTNPSTVVPMHAVRVSPGLWSIEVDYRRLALHNNPTLVVSDAAGKCVAYMYVWAGRGDLVDIDRLDGTRRLTFGNDQHGLGSFSDPGKWFGLRLLIDTERKTIVGYVRSGGGEWVQLNQNPLPYHDPQADGSVLFVGFGSRRLEETVDDNILEMDQVRVRQVRTVGP